MKITPMPSVSMGSVGFDGNPRPSNVENVRSMVMKTNATPLPNQLAPQDPNADVNIQAQASDATQPLSPQLAFLAKQRRALQQQRRELENEKKALLAQSSGSTGIDVARLKSEPLSVLLENGVTYDQLTEAIMAGQGKSELNALKAEIQSLKQGIDQKFTDKDAAAEKQVYAAMQREAQQLVRGDDFELVRETRGVPHVMSLIERTYKDTGEILDVPEALRLVEDELFKDAQKLTRLKKMQSQQIIPQAQPTQRQFGMRTLTNRDTASIVPLSAKARAMAAFYGTLPKR